MVSLIQARMAASDAMIAAFGDAALLRAALRFEVELARAQAAEGLITGRAAEVIAEAAAVPLDPADIAAEAAFSGTLAIAIVARLRASVARIDPDSAGSVHLGATSQDLADTAMMMQLKAATHIIRRDTLALRGHLAALAERHIATPMIGRTLLQSALPITFGLKVAQWLAGIEDARRLLDHATDTALAVQLGGAVGTRAGLAGKADAIADRLAVALDLPGAGLPWHARRGNLAALGSALAILVGALAKAATAIALMAQNEVAEAHEPRQAGRGGSSAMAHKRNPTGCQVVRSAALRAPGLAAALLSALPQEHERGLGGWQIEAPVLAELFGLAHGALEALLPVVEGLEVDPAAMRRNLERAQNGDNDVGEAMELARRALETYARS